MAFYEVQLPDQIPYGLQGGPFFQTIVITSNSQAEQRFKMSSRAFRKYTLDEQAMDLIDMAMFEEFFYMAQGKNNGFRFKDKKDYQATNEPVSQYTSGGTHFGQLTKLYNHFSYGSTETRPIRKPQTGTVPVTLTRDGSPWAASGNWSLDTTTGIITFVADQTGHTILWSGEFDVPVRFDFDEMSSTWNDFNDLVWNGLTLLELNI